MRHITLNYNDAICALEDEDDPNVRVIAACTVALFETSEHAAEIDSSTRAIALKVSHMIAEAIYTTPASADQEVPS